MTVAASFTHDTHRNFTGLGQPHGATDDGVTVGQVKIQVGCASDRFTGLGGSIIATAAGHQAGNEQK
jgi:hypothetical protein